MTMLRIGTRGSRLALWQAQWVAHNLCEQNSSLKAELVTIQTEGERQLEMPLSLIGDKGFFTDEIEAALLEGSIDIAVHSLKDLPHELSEGLDIGAFCLREDPRDVFISANEQLLEDLPPGSLIGTSSLRRVAQVMGIRPDLCCTEIRGNVDTRLRKLERSTRLSGIILAAAGVIRLGLQDRITQYFDEEYFLPAPGQGIIAVEVSTSRNDVCELIAELNHLPSEYEARAERSFSSALEGGCQVPIGARARYTAGTLSLRGMVASLDGSESIWTQHAGTNPELVGYQAAQDILKQDTTKILTHLNRSKDRTGSCGM